MADPNAPPSFQEEFRPGGSKRNVEVADRIFGSLPLTKPGREWLTAAVDPFHDLEYRLQGYPDGTGTRSVCQLVRRTATISRPEAVALGSTWDCHIAFLPVNQTVSMQPCGLYGGKAQVVTPVAPPAGMALGPVTIVSCAAGKLTYPDPSVPASVPQPESNNGNLMDGSCTYETLDLGRVESNATGVEVSDPYCNGRHRIIGAAFEVINATPMLTAGGTCTTYKFNSQATARHRSFTSGPIGDQTGVRHDGFFMQSPPPQVKQAVLMPNSRQFPAKCGAYVTAQISAEDLDVQIPQPTAIILQGNEPDAGSPGQGDNTTSDGLLAIRGVPAVYGNDYPYIVSQQGPAWISTNKFLTSGAYFTGLSSETVLTVNARFLVERFPSPEDELSTVAWPVEEYDPLCYRYYAEIMNHMPSGVVLDDNFLGKWVRSAASVAQKAIRSPAGRIATDMALDHLSRSGPKGMVASHALRYAMADRRRAGNLQHDAANDIRAAEGRRPITELQRERRREKRRRNRARRRERKMLEMMPR